MKKNKLSINAFEKYSISFVNKTNIKGGYPEGWTGEIPVEDENTWQTGDDPTNSTGGPGTSTLSTGVIRPNGPNGTNGTTSTTTLGGIRTTLP
jgi:hypothetical protein